jgi:hypothetical protein
MKRIFGLLVGLAVLGPAQARADGWCPFFCIPPYRVECGLNAYFRVVPIEQGNLAPWYTYWPYEAQMMSAGPFGHYPFWNGQQGAPAVPTMPMPRPSQPNGMANPPSGYQPAGYTQAPNYWYTR